MTLVKDNDPRLGATLVCVVSAQGCAIGPSPEPLAAALAALASERAGQDFPPAALKEAVRGMLRAGGYKPAGRQKPASEYLAQAAREGRFPSINAPVDCNNLLSLETGLPISLLDADALGGSCSLRICAEGESYVFNQAGHEMDLAGLLCVCGADGAPMGNPVKDSMRGKLREGTTGLAGFIFAPASEFSPERLRAIGERFASLLSEHCGAASARVEGIA